MKMYAVYMEENECNSKQLQHLKIFLEAARKQEEAKEKKGARIQARIFFRHLAKET